VQKQLSDLEQKLDGAHSDLKSTISRLGTEIRQILADTEGSAGNAIGLENASAGLTSALAVVESGDRAVPSQAIALYHDSSEALKRSIADWNHFKTTRLLQLNQQLHQGNMAPIAISELAEDADLS
jgi:hypothetical protein